MDFEKRANSKASRFFEWLFAIVIINLFTISYFEQAVDFKVNTSYILALGRGVKTVKNFYQELDRLVTVIKKG